MCPVDDDACEVLVVDFESDLVADASSVGPLGVVDDEYVAGLRRGDQLEDDVDAASVDHGDGRADQPPAWSERAELRWTVSQFDSRSSCAVGDVRGREVSERLVGPTQAEGPFLFSQVDASGPTIAASTSGASCATRCPVSTEVIPSSAAAPTSRSISSGLTADPVALTR